VLLNNKEIPGLDGSPVELSWAGNNGASGSVPTNILGVKTPHAAGASATASVSGDHSASTGTRSNNETNPTKTDKTTAAVGGGGGDEEGGISSSDKDVHILLNRPTDENEMDYEVADEEHWGY